MESVIIEELGRDDKLVARHKYQQSEVNIGRSYHNDIILSDPHVCPEHLKLRFDGNQWTVVDLESVNGSFLKSEGNKVSVSQHAVHSGDIIKIGKSQIRIVLPHHPVEESVVFSPYDDLISMAKNPLVILIGIVLFTLLNGYLFHLNKGVESNFTQLLVPAVGMTLLFAAWPLGVALVAHLTKNDARIWHQLGMSFIFFNLLWLSDYIEVIIKFNASSQWPIGLMVLALPVIISFCLFWLNAYISYHMTNKRRCTVAAGLVLSLIHI